LINLFIFYNIEFQGFLSFRDNPFCFFNIMESRLRFFVSASGYRANPLYLNEINI